MKISRFSRLFCWLSMLLLRKRWQNTQVRDEQATSPSSVAEVAPSPTESAAHGCDHTLRIGGHVPVAGDSTQRQVFNAIDDTVSRAAFVANTVQMTSTLSCTACISFSYTFNISGRPFTSIVPFIYIANGLGCDANNIGSRYRLLLNFRRECLGCQAIHYNAMLKAVFKY